MVLTTCLTLYYLRLKVTDCYQTNILFGAKYHSGLEGHTITFLFFGFLCFKPQFKAYKDNFLSLQAQKSNFNVQNDIGKCGIRTCHHFLSVLDLEKCDFQLQFSYIRRIYFSFCAHKCGGIVLKNDLSREEFCNTSEEILPFHAKIAIFS